jgi:hypothetical protein
VAKRFDIKEKRLSGLIDRKEIKAIKIGHWKIKTEDLEDFIKNRRNY